MSELPDPPGSPWWDWRLRPRGAANVDTPQAGVATAQQNYEVLVKDHLSPAFRDVGLRGTGGRYSLPIEVPGWALLGLQKSSYSDKAEIRFTVNLLVVTRASWFEARESKPYLPEKPSAGVIYGAGEAQARIGSLHPDGADKWWRVLAGPPALAVADDVIQDVATLALPWLQEHAARH